MTDNYFIEQFIVYLNQVRKYWYYKRCKFTIKRTIIQIDNNPVESFHLVSNKEGALWLHVDVYNYIAPLFEIIGWDEKINFPIYNKKTLRQIYEYMI